VGLFFPFAQYSFGLFIITYNYEQFYETSKTPVQLSEETHERVNAVIMSIVMAILVIMFYFKSGFNFDPKSGLMKVLANSGFSECCSCFVSGSEKL
jgi:hypothetical protein